MASYLRKCLALGYGVLEGPGHPQSLDYRSNRPEFGAPYATYASDNTFFIADTGTRWVRLQVNLSRLWPTETGMDVGQRDQLDRQLAMARHYGCRTIVELGRFYPPWLNGSTDPQVRPTARHMAYGVGNVGDRDGAWCRMINWFVTRYNVHNANRPYSGLSTIDVLEIFNEPNLALRPAGKASPDDGFLNRAHCVATGMLRAKQIIAHRAGAPIIGAPAMHDTDNNAAEAHRHYLEFTDNILWYLAGNGFYSVSHSTLDLNASVVWTMHNYNDVTYDHGPNTTCPDRDRYGRYLHESGFYTIEPSKDRRNLRTKMTRELLGTGGSSKTPWKGWPYGDSSIAEMFVTEGGADLALITGTGRSYAPWGSYYSPSATSEDTAYARAKTLQASLTARNLSRMQDNTLGGGVALVSNYLTYSDHRPWLGSSGDSGLVDDPGTEPGGGLRPVYPQWKSFPGRL